MRNRPGIYGRVMCPPYTAEDAEFLAERNKVLEEAVNGLAAENFELREDDPVPTNECLYDGKPVYTQRVLKLEEYTVPFCSNCDHRLDDCAGSFCPVCGSIIEERRRT